MSSFQDFLDSLNNDESNEWYGSNQEFAKQIMDWYSNWLSGKLNPDSEEEENYEPDMSAWEVIEDE